MVIPARNLMNILWTFRGFLCSPNQNLDFSTEKKDKEKGNGGKRESCRMVQSEIRFH